MPAKIAKKAHQDGTTLIEAATALELLTPEQFAEWGEYYVAEPWGFELDDLLHARLMALVGQAAEGANGVEGGAVAVLHAAQQHGHAAALE